ncbi:MAG TPA: HlyD family efflux transporter periplasmic adaptor subunit, partial [Calditrichaeota bacterium]|nr:HlyD family efflux transporter periplasmic adaptor subunit [Calditrichota bacterium]
MRKILFLGMAVFLVLAGCSDNDERGLVYDGRLDADIIQVSAKIAGTIDSLLVEEGDAVQKNQLLAQIETDRIEAQLKIEDAQLGELQANLQAMEAQIRQIRAQLSLAEKMLSKTQNMLKEGAATDQKRDELSTQVDVLQAKLQAIRAQQATLAAKRKQLQAKKELTLLNLRDTRLLSPINGVVVNTFKNAKEVVQPGITVLDVADLSTMEAVIYVPLVELDKVKFGQKATLHIDAGNRTFEGQVKWISSQAEFTPKTILTRETRESLVYAVKLTVPNPEGILKIGMPVEVV